MGRRWAALVATAAALLALSACRGGENGGTASAAGAPPAAAPAKNVSAATSWPAPDAATVTPPPLASDIPPVAAPPAASPTEAVEAFVAAEVAGDAGRAWALLSAADRRDTRSPAAWRAAHEHLPHFRAVHVDGPTVASRDGAPVTVHATVEFDPGLDEVRGLVPATAIADWVMQAEDGGWRVAYGASTFTPVVPDDPTGARLAVTDWLGARQAAPPSASGGCTRPAQEWSGGLVGVPGLANRLCGKAGPLQVGEPTPFASPTDATALIAAFGPEVLTWSRVVPIAAPVPMQAVVAPVGPQWQVIGALLPSGAG